jgi:hypothetical protein
MKNKHVCFFPGRLLPDAGPWRSSGVQAKRDNLERNPGNDEFQLDGYGHSRFVPLFS